jgi:chromosome segregation ATPase
MSFARRGLALALAALFVVACGEDRATPLKAEIAKLKKERVPVDQLHTAEKEADEGEAQRTEALAKADRDEAAVTASKAELERLRAGLQSETDRNAALRAELDARVDANNTEATALDAAETRAGERRRELDTLRDQAKALIKQMRPGDPEWAMLRRYAVITDYSHRASAQLESEPAVIALAALVRQEHAAPADLLQALQAVADTCDAKARQSETAAAAK